MAQCHLNSGRCQNVDLSTSAGVIAKADTTHFRFSPKTTDLHNRTIMISTNPEDLTKKCSNTFHEILKQEYDAMIEQGRTAYKNDPLNLHEYAICHAIAEHIRISGDDMSFIDAFIELAFMTDTDSSSIKEDNTTTKAIAGDMATKIITARETFDEEIAKDRRSLEEIKSQFLQKGDEIEGVQSLSANLLRVIKRLQAEDYGYESIWHALHGDYYEEHAAVDNIYIIYHLLLVCLEEIEYTRALNS